MTFTATATTPPPLALNSYGPMNKSNNKRGHMLDVEDEDARQDRLKTLFENLNASNSTGALPFGRGESAEHHPHIESPKFGFDFGDRSTFPVQPPTELLSRVRAFLPQLQASNQILEKRMEDDPESVDIEHLSEGMNQFIEMNLGLGLFEDRSKRQHSSESEEDAEMSTSSSSESSLSSACTSDPEIPFRRGTYSYEDDNDSDESSDAEIITSFVPYRPIRPLPRRATDPKVTASPEIVVIGDKDKSCSSL
ncbi:hypothetical protein CPB83DRAFT_831741 [Crepidotus variabilis]|uniref:Uncharacterized protein n=1 Tax=Crepidotus variabilis TaxID=179855 RepID=A0A9P6ESN2_9AGAR|nr:hypothetical protein CPB83DRAFT_831741 [Crepidotus variabilis]